MNGTLAPKSLGDILSETFAIYKKNFLRFAAIMSIVIIPFAVVLSIFFSLLVPLPGELGIEAPSPFISLILIPIYLVYFAAFIWMVGAVIHAVAEQYFNQPIDIGRAYSFAWHRLGDMFWAVVLVTLAILGIYLAAILISVIIAIAIGGTSGWFVFVAFAITGITILIAILPIFYLSTIWSFTQQTALLEDCGPTAALSRSAALVKGSWWRVLGVVLLLMLIVQTMIGILVMIFYIPAMMATVSQFTSGFTPYGTPEFPIWLMIGAITSGFIGNIISMPIYIIGQTLLYFDLRVRKQGYSLDTLADELGLPSTSTDSVP